MDVILSSGGSTILYVELLNEKGENQQYSHLFLHFSLGLQVIELKLVLRTNWDPYYRGVIPYHDD